MTSPFIIGRVSGDKPVRGQDATVTRIYYQSPPPRTSITDENDDGGLSSRKLVYEDRGVTSVLQTSVYPRSKTLTLLSKEALGKPVVRYEPQHTPPDCFEAQDFALRKAEILLKETERADKQAKLSKPPRRDSAVSEDDESELPDAVTTAEPQEALANVQPQEQVALSLPPIIPEETLAIPAPPKSPIKTLPQRGSARKSPQRALASIEHQKEAVPTEPQIIITTTEPLDHHEDEVRESPKRRKLSSSPRSGSPVQLAKVQPSSSRAPSESRFAKPKTPPAPAVTAPAVRGESVVSVASVRSNDSKSSRRSRGPRAIKDDLTIDSKFGQDADNPNEVQYMDKKGNWYDAIGEGWPSWAVNKRQKVATATVTPKGRRATGAWRRPST